MAGITRKQLKHDEIADAAVDATHWVERHWQLVVKWAAAALVLVMAVLGWTAYARHSEQKARERLAEGLSRYQQAERTGFTDTQQLSGALDLFEQARDQAGGSSPGQVARYFRGVTLYRMGRHDEAVSALSEVAAADVPPSLGGATQAMIAQVHAAAGRTQEAISLLTQLAEQTGGAYPPEEALLKLGWVHAGTGNMDEARRVWQRLLDQYPQSPAAREVTELLGPKNASSAPAS